MPVHFASDVSVTPFAIWSRWFEGSTLPSLCWTFLNTDEHMALTMVPSSNSAHICVCSPLGPSRFMLCMNGAVYSAALVGSVLAE